MIEFGHFDRDSAIMDLLIENAPVSQQDFVEILYQEYGYDKGTAIGSYLKPFDQYYHKVWNRYRYYGQYGNPYIFIVP